MWHVEKFLHQSLTRFIFFSIPNLMLCKEVDSKSDKTKKNWFKIWHDEENVLIQNHAFTKTFSFKMMLFWENFTFKIMLFGKKNSLKVCFLKMHVNVKICAFFWGKLNQKVMFCMQFFFGNLLSKKHFFFNIVFSKKLFSSKSCFIKNQFFYKTWRVVKFLIQNLTGCKKLQFKTCQFLKLLPKSEVFLVFQVLAAW